MLKHSGSLPKKKVQRLFYQQLNDAETENAETEVWLDFAKDCNYISSEEYEELVSLNTEAGKLIWFMINNPNKFI